MKHRVPTLAEVKLWRESNRFTRKVQDEESESAKEEASFDSLLSSSPSKGEARRGATGGTVGVTDAPTPTLPLRGREKAPLAHLATREAARFIKSYPEIEATLDLHGLNKIDAYERVQRFITKHYRAGHRHLLIITGKGRIGPGLLRSELPHWLNEPSLRPLISAFAHASPEKGGTGVTHVLVKKYRDR